MIAEEFNCSDYQIGEITIIRPRDKDYQIGEIIQ